MGWDGGVMVEWSPSFVSNSRGIDVLDAHSKPDEESWRPKHAEFADLLEVTRYRKFLYMSNSLRLKIVSRTRFIVHCSLSSFHSSLRSGRTAGPEDSSWNTLYLRLLAEPVHLSANSRVLCRCTADLHLGKTILVHLELLYI